jgi:prepilin-type N-terminal cleavage/methylation domain-containing protein
MMNRRTNRRTTTQRGLTLIEVLVATAVLTVIFLGVLLMYERSTKSFKSGMEAADVQQNTRVAFDKMVSDLRLTGFDYDRDGFPSGQVGSTWAANRAYGVGSVVVPTAWNGFNYRATVAGTSNNGAEPAWPTTDGATITDGTVTWEALAASGSFQQPDEQVEYAGPTAVTIRGNLDHDLETQFESGREGLANTHNYESLQFPVVTTGNDEIVTYALRSTNGAANTQSIQFYADVNNGGAPSRTAYPGGSAERLITIPNVDLTNANPPYTLYRFTLDAAGAVVASPVAENIRSLNFSYFMDQQGRLPLRDLGDVVRAGGETILGAGQYNPANPTALVSQRAVRSRIKAVRVTLVGMTSQPDPQYRDVSDPVSSARNFRKYRLESLVVPRNIGKRGLREQDTTPPGPPTLDRVLFGHCCVAKLEWSPPVTGGGAESYAVLWDTDNVGGFAHPVQVGLTTSMNLVLPDPTATYYFAIVATSSFGNSPESNVLSGSPKNRTTPEAPGTLSATAGTNSIDLTWGRPINNVPGADVLVGVPSGSVTEGVVAQELMRYFVYRSTAAFATTPDPPSSLLIWSGATGTGAPVENIGTNQVTFRDTTAVNCVQYHYRVLAKDLCEDDPAKNVGTNWGISGAEPDLGSPAFVFTNPGTDVDPSDPSALVLGAGSLCDGTNCTVILQWPPVTTDVNGDPVTIDQYEIEVSKKLGNGAPFDFQTVTGGPIAGFAGGTGNETYTVSGLPQPSGAFDKYQFRVRALQCDDYSGFSSPVTFPCTYSGGTPSFAVSSAIDGNGTSGSPFLVYSTGSIVASGLTGAQPNVDVTIYAGAAPISGPTAYTISGGAITIPIGDPADDGTNYRAVLSVTDTSGCNTAFTVYYTGSANPCCLRLETITGFTVGNDDITVTTRNICGSTVTMNSTGSVAMRFKSANFAGGAKLDDITFPNTSAGTTTMIVGGGDGNANSLVTHNASSASNVDYAIEANSLYSIRFDWSKNISSTTTPAISDMCITYDSTNVCNIIDDAAAPSCP